MKDVLQWSYEPIWKWDILLITLDGSHVPLVVKLNFDSTNNMVEYEACITEMEALQARGKGGRSLWRFNLGHNLSTKVVGGERRTPKSLPIILEGVKQRPLTRLNTLSSVGLRINSQILCLL